MSKFSLLVVIVAITIALDNVAESSEIPPVNSRVEDRQDGVPPEANSNERSGAYAYASLSVKQQSNYGPYGQTANVNPKVGRTTSLSYLGLVECYACTDCPEVLQNTTTKWCPRTYGQSHQTACVAYAEQYRHMKKNWYVRGCATERGTCADIRQSHELHGEIVKLLFCDECEGNKCNTSGAPRSFADLSLAILTLFIVPLAAKMTLS